MASSGNVLEAQLKLPYFFRDMSLLQKALTAGDTNSQDRVGHRGLAQVGDALMSFVILSEGFERGVSRSWSCLKVLHVSRSLANCRITAEEQSDARSMYTSKETCAFLARVLGFNELVKISERQIHEGPQPTTLKNTLAAIVAAVWQDSRDYCAVLEVMASLGLINYIEPRCGSQNASSMEWTAAPLRSNEGVPGWSDNTTRPFDFEPFVNDELLVSEQILNPSFGDLYSDWFTADLATASVDQVGFAPLGTTYGAGVAPQGGYDTSNNLPVVDPSALDPGGAHGQPSSSEGVGDVSNSLGPGVFSTSARQSDARTLHPRTNSEASNSKKNARFQPPGQTIARDIRIVFDAFMATESRKLNSPINDSAQNYTYTKPYQEALSSIKPSREGSLNYKNLARMALSVGDCSAMLTLKQAIESIRAPTSSSSFQIGRNLTTKERIDIIYRLGLCTAQFRIARWLHIHQLYEELSINVGGKDVDNFVIVTNADLDNGSPESRLPVQRGNPRNIEQAAITRRMMDHNASGASNNEDQRKARAATKRMRRIGYRLQLLVHRWGLGVLCLLGVVFTDEMMIGVPDTPFTEFLDVVNRFEGESIRCVSKAAEAAVQLFMDDSNAHPRLLIEVTEQEHLEQLTRLSVDMQVMFTNVDQI